MFILCQACFNVVAAQLLTTAPLDTEAQRISGLAELTASGGRPGGPQQCIPLTLSPPWAQPSPAGATLWLVPGAMGAKGSRCSRAPIPPPVTQSSNLWLLPHAASPGPRPENSPCPCSDALTTITEGKAQNPCHGLTMTTPQSPGHSCPFLPTCHCQPHPAPNICLIPVNMQCTSLTPGSAPQTSRVGLGGPALWRRVLHTHGCIFCFALTSAPTSEPGHRASVHWAW